MIDEKRDISTSHCTLSELLGRSFWQACRVACASVLVEAACLQACTYNWGPCWSLPRQTEPWMAATICRFENVMLRVALCTVYTVLFLRTASNPSSPVVTRHSTSLEMHWVWSTQSGPSMPDSMQGSSPAVSWKGSRHLRRILIGTCLSCQSWSRALPKLPLHASQRSQQL